MTHKTPESLMRAVRGRVAKSVKRAEKVIDEELEDQKRDFIELTSGTESQASLNKANNPFGRGFTNPRGKVRGRRRPLPLNKQSGKFQAGGRIVRRNMTTGRFDRDAEWRFEVHGVPYAKYVARRSAKPGSKMIYRPLWDEMIKRRNARTYKRQNQFRRRGAA